MQGGKAEWHPRPAIPKTGVIVASAQYFFRVLAKLRRHRWIDFFGIFNPNPVNQRCNRRRQASSIGRSTRPSNICGSVRISSIFRMPKVTVFIEQPPTRRNPVWRMRSRIGIKSALFSIRAGWFLKAEDVAELGPVDQCRKLGQRCKLVLVM